MGTLETSQPGKRNSTVGAWPQGPFEVTPEPLSRSTSQAAPSAAPKARDAYVNSRVCSPPQPEPMGPPLPPKSEEGAGVKVGGTSGDDTVPIITVDQLYAADHAADIIARLEPRERAKLEWWLNFMGFAVEADGDDDDLAATLAFAMSKYLVKSDAEDAIDTLTLRMCLKMIRGQPRSRLSNLQQQLRAFGLYPEPPDGLPGPLTARGVRSLLIAAAFNRHPTQELGPPKIAVVERLAHQSLEEIQKHISTFDGGRFAHLLGDNGIDGKWGPCTEGALEAIAQATSTYAEGSFETRLLTTIVVPAAPGTVVSAPGQEAPPARAANGTRLARKTPGSVAPQANPRPTAVIPDTRELQSRPPAPPRAQQSQPKPVKRVAVPKPAPSPLTLLVRTTPNQAEA